ncbi:MAG: glycoside hydrolase family 3 N-terminal domain-containing protein [Candidatus Marinimicrobia bacterium]|nr:glycoside hydrolase family 3 N-terminal domain-containing protein [Candidatus Neomarinimicrobiota bacterium]
MYLNAHTTALRKIVILALLSGLLHSAIFGQANPIDSLDIDRLKQEIGQMLMVGIRGSNLNAHVMQQTRRQITNGDIGGIIFFKHNIKNSRQFRIFVKSISTSPAPHPLLLAVDEEGGQVRRLRKAQGFIEFPSAAHVGKNFNDLEADAVYSQMATQIHRTGLNLNLGPVVDVNVNRASPAIGQLNRSFSRDPGRVFDLGEIFIRAHRAKKVLTTLKHYPGHGSSREDTHNDLTDITHTWRSSEQLPFRRLIDSSLVDLIMAGHLFDHNIDSKYPASLSREHIQKTLRGELGYTGVVITDDLQMGAIIKRYGLDEIIIAAINAGCDILQFSDPLNLEQDLPSRVRRVVITAIKSGEIDPQRIHESYERIVDLKNSFTNNSDKTTD